MVRSCLEAIDILAFTETFTSLQLNRIGSSLKSLKCLEQENLTDKENLTFVKQRRLMAKLLVIVLEDFSKLIATDAQARERIRILTRQAWGLSIGNLTYL